MLQRILPAAVLTWAALGVAPDAAAQGRAFSGFSVWDIHTTDVADAADGDDPYDFDLFVLYDQSVERGTIQREYHCSNATIRTPNATGDQWISNTPTPTPDSNCSAEDRIVSAREMEFDRDRKRVNILGRFGVWKDIEIHAALPIVVSDRIKLDMASRSDKPGALELKPWCFDASCSQSSVYREDALGNANWDLSFFHLPNEGPQRAGIDNPTFGLWWAPYNHERDDTVASWRIGVDYQPNLVSRMKASEKKGVGQGYDELRVSTGMSRRFSVLHPFVELSYSISNLLESKELPFYDYGNGQTLVEPGDRLGLRFGTQVIPWDDPTRGMWFALDLGADFVYQFEGRDYTPLFSALGSSECNSRATCELTKLTGKDAAGQALATDGITDVEQFGVVRGWFGFQVQAHRMVRFIARATLVHQLAHFLTFADAGKDNELQGQYGNVEYNAGLIDPGTPEENPVFNENMDLAGSRFRLSSHLDFGFFFAGAMTF